MIPISLTAQKVRRLALWLLVALGLAAGVTSFAQSGRGTLTGSVKDANGAVLQGATLTLTGTNTGSRFTAIASADGLFTFPELPPGTYALTVTAPGFESFTQNGITVYVGSTATVNPELRVGAATESVTVNGDASQLQAKASHAGTTVSTELIEDLPLQFSGEPRNPLQFVT